MAAKFLRAFGYKGDNMDLPVRDVDAAVPFYTDVLGFTVFSKDEADIKAVTLERDEVQICLRENGGDPEQDGCAFHVDDVEELRREFVQNGLASTSQIKEETRGDGSRFKAFFVVAPDGLCYWVGERLP